jgi:hypothetical protein
VWYLVERYGFWRIRRILKELKKERPLADVLSGEFHLKLPRLEAAWREWLPESLTKSVK